MADKQPEPTKADDREIFKQAGPDGEFRRQNAQFRSYVSADPDSEFPAEKDRYVLYIVYGCPWAHRTNIVLHLKGLESIIQLVVLDYKLGPQGWFFSGRLGTDKVDPIYGFTHLRQLYWKADPSYDKRFTVPVLWDKKRETLVSNESSEIIRMLYTEFDEFLPEEKREAALKIYPENLRNEIEDMNEWVYETINNGVYKTGFATTQEAYDSHLYPLFESLARLEKHLSEPGHTPYLFGAHITEPDIRLFTTLIRFDVAYHTIFKCNLKMIRHDFPRLHEWLRMLYWDSSDRTNGGAFKNTTKFDQIKIGYATGLEAATAVVPGGPDPDILPLELDKYPGFSVSPEAGKHYPGFSVL
ncbi:MAG: hypothetical protein M1836_000249 [Candelina mexicana]|nr:MAG: hypothetical protein M1836_000249 [Candelina mexicana]